MRLSELGTCYTAYLFFGHTLGCPSGISESPPPMPSDQGLNAAKVIVRGMIIEGLCSPRSNHSALLYALPYSKHYSPNGHPVWSAWLPLPLMGLLLVPQTPKICSKHQNPQCVDWGTASCLKTSHTACTLAIQPHETATNSQSSHANCCTAPTVPQSTWTGRQGINLPFPSPQGEKLMVLQSF